MATFSLENILTGQIYIYSKFRSTAVAIADYLSSFFNNCRNLLPLSVHFLM